MKRYFALHIFIFICCFNGLILNIQSQTPDLIIYQREFSVCHGDTVTVEIEITGPDHVFLDYLFEGETIHASSTSNNITLELFQAGVYNIIQFGNENITITDVNDSIVIEDYPAPNVYFTGGGAECNNEEMEPLVAHFEGEPPFELAYLFNNRPYTLYVDGYIYTFPTDQPFVIVTQSLTDANCQTDLVIHAQFLQLDLTLPVIYGDTILCKFDSTVYSTDQSNFSEEWLVSGGADYLEGFNEGGSFISVTWIEPGTHEIQLRLVDSISQCASQWSTLNVTVYEKPETIELIDTALCFELEEYLYIEIPTESDETITWPELGITGSSVQIYNEGTYRFINTNQYNCSDTGTLNIVNNCTWDIFVPEAFTPNNDGINDYLVIFGLYDELELSIYSPSGILLFYATEEDPPWDGTKDGQDIPNGSYYWHASFKGNDGITRNKSGVVTIIR